MVSRERREIEERTNKFNVVSSEAFQAFRQRNWSGLKMLELRAIGEVLSDIGRVRFDREARRRKNVFFKWVDENWSVFSDIVGQLDIEFTPE
jgi:hypothetical protein